jgi:preprotein translocase subunit SecD
MKKSTVFLIIFVLFFSIWFSLPKPNFDLQIPRTPINFTNYLGNFPLRLGLDLQGGTQLVLEAQMGQIEADQRDNALESAREVIERRVNLFGVSESVVQTSKVGDSRRILVDLPGIKNASDAADLVGRTAQLEFKELVTIESTESATPSSEFVSTGLTGKDLKKASVSFGQGQSTDGSPVVQLEFNAEGAKKFAEITKRNIAKPLAIFLDEQLVQAPTVNTEILDGNAIISGGFTVDSAKQAAVQLNAGALPVPIKIIEQRSIGATLGQESINKSLVAAGIGLLTVMLYMILYYGRLGVVASVALVIYTLVSVAIFRTGLFIMPPITLTLAGIAGFILSIGMAVDANILIFERMKEERRWGKNNKQALDLGFKRAWSSIRDSNSSSLITAGILYFLGTGPVKGFAITFAVGVLVSMFSAIIVTRTLLRLFIKR